MHAHVCSHACAGCEHHHAPVNPRCKLAACPASGSCHLRAPGVGLAGRHQEAQQQAAGDAGGLSGVRRLGTVCALAEGKGGGRTPPFRQAGPRGAGARCCQSRTARSSRAGTCPCANHHGCGGIDPCAVWGVGAGGGAVHNHRRAAAMLRLPSHHTAPAGDASPPPRLPPACTMQERRLQEELSLLTPWYEAHPPSRGPSPGPSRPASRTVSPHRSVSQRGCRGHSRATPVWRRWVARVYCCWIDVYDKPRPRDMAEQ